METEEIQRVGDYIGILGVQASRISNAIQPLPDSAEVDYVHHIVMSVVNTLTELERYLHRIEQDAIEKRNEELYHISRITEV